MTDIHPTQIVNPIRNSNTTLQSSTLQSSNTSLNKNYSFQSLRTVKGNIIANCIDTAGNGVFTVLNMYDGTPIKLNYGDIVIGIVISNASNPQPDSAATEFFNPTYNNYAQPWAFNGYEPQTPKMTFLLTQQPIYNVGVSTPTISQVFPYASITDYNNPIQTPFSWTPNMSGTPIPLNSPFNNASTGPLYFAEFPPNGCSIPVIYQNCVGVGNYQWLTCEVVSLGMNGRIAGINVNLLILNPTSTQ
jgi:hypothetical protein